MMEVKDWTVLLNRINKIIGDLEIENAYIDYESNSMTIKIREIMKDEMQTP